MKRIWAGALLWTALAFGFGCSHGSHHADQSATTDAPYKFALDGAFKEAAQNSRAPSQETPATANLNDLRRIKPGHFSVFVFPIHSDRAEKSRVGDQPLYANAKLELLSRLGKPLEYEISVLAVAPCFQFTERNAFARLNAKDYFDMRLGESKSRQCAILQATALKIKNADRALIRADDLLRTRVYLDDAYVLHGYELEKFNGRRDLETVKVKTEAQASTSGLSTFPVDLPTLAILGGGTAARIRVSEKIDKFATRQIEKLARSFVAADCDGREVTYRDYYGSPVTVGWCKDLPFPQFMQNSRFIAVTQTLSLR